MIPIADLQAQLRSIRPEIDAAIARVLDSAQFVLGSEVAAFEEEFAAYCDAKYCVAMNSGTSALHLALLAAGIGPGDEVITVPFTFVATVATIGYTGARARLVDIDPRRFTMDPARLGAAITLRTKAIIPVHLYGQMADMDPILAIARRHGLTVIEDAAQAHGAEYKGRRAGSMGEVGCFSFYPGKNLGACGEGGAAITNNPELARKLRLLRDWGQDGKYRHVVKGYNYRMDGLQGAILRVKLQHLESWTKSRQTHAGLYNRRLVGAPACTPAAMDGGRHVYQVYALRSRRRDELQASLLQAGIETRVHYPVPIHLLEAYRDLGYREGDFPESEAMAREQLSLPVYAEMSAAQVEEVAAAVRR